MGRKLGIAILLLVVLVGGLVWQRLGRGRDSGSGCRDVESRIISPGSKAWFVLGDKWWWVDGNLVVAWQEPEVKALIAEAVRESAEGPEIIARYDEMAEANEPAFMANVSLVFVGMKLKREGMLAYKKSRWMHIRPGGLVCWSSPLECRRYEQDSQPLTGDEAQEGFDAFRSVLVANRIPEFCADMDAEVDEIFAEYEAKVARCGGGNWPSMKEYCASALAVLREFN